MYFFFFLSLPLSPSFCPSIVIAIMTYVPFSLVYIKNHVISRTDLFIPQLIIFQFQIVQLQVTSFKSHSTDFKFSVFFLYYVSLNLFHDSWFTEANSTAEDESTPFKFHLPDDTSLSLSLSLSLTLSLSPVLKRELRLGWLNFDEPPYGHLLRSQRVFLVYSLSLFKESISFWRPFIFMGLKTLPLMKMKTVHLLRYLLKYGC